MILRLMAIGLLTCTAAVNAATTAIPADNPNLYYVGRFDHRDPAGPRCEWSDSSVSVHFRGKSVRFDLTDTGQDRYQLVVDGTPFPPTTLGQGIRADLPDDGEHTVALVKITEAFVGVGQLLGIELPGGQLLPPRRLTRRIEVIGDSISCGYGDEAPNEHVHFSPATENGYLAYGAIAARAVGAEYVCIAWSGRKMWPDNTIPELYDRTLPTDPTSQWDFGTPPPDVVLINLATNDFGHENPDEKGWTTAYEAFVRRVRGHYPSALIYIASGTMMTDTWPPGQHAVTTLAGYLDKIQSDLKAAGETRTRLLPFGVQDGNADGLGADYHPSLKTHQKMAAKFEAALQVDLGWRPAATQP